ncbi:MAG: GNAT family N-acetyltransferase [Kofleriaceae bacterium]
MDRVWFDRSFGELTTEQLYRIVELRERVFVVEQRCVYLDADGVDRVSRHVWAESDRPTSIDAYLRIVPAGVKYAEVAIGRVVVAPHARGTGLGKALMLRGLAAAGAVPVRIGAQAHLEKFYGELGFIRASDDYDDDGIPHLDMLRA